MRHYVAEWSYF